jgi:hypothetical protein
LIQNDAVPQDHIAKGTLVLIKAMGPDRDGFAQRAARREAGRPAAVRLAPFRAVNAIESDFHSRAIAKDENTVPVWNTDDTTGELFGEAKRR